MQGKSRDQWYRIVYMHTHIYVQLYFYMYLYKIVQALLEYSEELRGIALGDAHQGHLPVDGTVIQSQLHHRK